MINTRQNIIDALALPTQDRFEELALSAFQYQYEQNAVYREYVDFLAIDPKQVKALSAIPFLPIQFFKSHHIQSGNWQAERSFLSSGTTGQLRSKHAVRSTSFYLDNTKRIFEQFYGALSSWRILALLPSYLEAGDSSLVTMTQFFIEESDDKSSDFLLDEYDKTLEILQDSSYKKTLLLGVTYALLDLAARCKKPLPAHCIVMETGGMKGRRKELIRSDMHKELQAGFGQRAIHSEYGMTELFSQAYAKEDGRFHCGNSMRVMIRDISDPLSLVGTNKTGAVNIIDLANIDSCCFIATEDLGRVYKDGSFEILGRLDAGELRGCNLLLDS